MKEMILANQKLELHLQKLILLALKLNVPSILITLRV